MSAPGNGGRRRLSRREREILGLLVDRGEMAGLELVEASPKLARGTVYVALRRLADKGLVASRAVNGAPFPALPRRLFRATGAAAAALDPRPAAGLAPRGAAAW